eukprot:TRINITY_DN90969_c0_g1_i1.p1 TRINITY_DN90969_c0_g1~~TRINITY_DN90969_c0_g1_i1.p1  ORF type:complete len:376 (+),score=28.40 TRINITY_DN90969_c0_g1_i1:1260-2387(+)
MPVIITAYEPKAIALMKEKCLKSGFASVYSDREFLQKLKNEYTKKGYKKSKAALHKSSCPICGSDAKSFYTTSDNIAVLKCLNCTHEFKYGFTSFVDIENLYSDISYYHRNPFSSDDIKKLEPQIANRLDIIKRYVSLDSSIDILEIGCLEGVLLLELKKRGHRVKGCEVNKPALEIGIKEFGLEIVSEDINTKPFPQSSFDLIYSFHVLEHLIDPKASLQACKEMLRNDGVMMMNLPLNEDDYENVEHLHFFNKKSANYLLKSVFGGGEAFESSEYYAGGIKYKTMDMVARKCQYQSYQITTTMPNIFRKQLSLFYPKPTKSGSLSQWMMAQVMSHKASSKSTQAKTPVSNLSSNQTEDKQALLMQDLKRQMEM